MLHWKYPKLKLFRIECTSIPNSQGARPDLRREYLVLVLLGIGYDRGSADNDPPTQNDYPLGGAPIGKLYRQILNQYLEKVRPGGHYNLY